MAKKANAPVITGNWKMHKTVGESLSFVEQLSPEVQGSAVSVYLAVPFTAIKPLADALGSSQMIVGAQNMNDASEGAFTGEIAGMMIKEAGAKFVILGHSERRHLFNESSALINKKVHRALAEGLQPVVCVGETLEQYESGETKKVLETQLKGSLDGVDAKDLPKLMLAYEPVWAIGTGKASSAKDAQKMHDFCRKVIGKTWGKAVADGLVIQYGGSVKPGNAEELMNQPDIDGLLVGGASLSSETFSQIVNYERKESKR